MSKPYDVQFSTPQEGDLIGWQDSDGVLHVEQLKNWRSDLVEVESSPDPVRRAHEVISEAEVGLRAIIGDEGEKA
jgi:hypothetical protein